MGEGFEDDFARSLLVVPTNTTYNTTVCSVVTKTVLLGIVTERPPIKPNEMVRYTDCDLGFPRRQCTLPTLPHRLRRM